MLRPWQRGDEPRDPPGALRVPAPTRSRKVSVYSETTTFLFRFGPYVLLATSLAGAFITPLLGGTPLVSFRFD